MDYYDFCKAMLYGTDGDLIQKLLSNHSLGRFYLNVVKYLHPLRPVLYCLTPSSQPHQGTSLRLDGKLFSVHTRQRLL